MNFELSGRVLNKKQQAITNQIQRLLNYKMVPAISLNEKEYGELMKVITDQSLGTFPGSATLSYRGVPISQI